MMVRAGLAVASDPESIMMSGVLFHDSACTSPFNRSDDWMLAVSPVRVPLDGCQFGAGKFERYSCAGAGQVLETVFNDAACTGIPLFEIRFSYNVCATNRLMPDMYWKSTWTGGCGEDASGTSAWASLSLVSSNTAGTRTRGPLAGAALLISGLVIGKVLSIFVHRASRCTYGWGSAQPELDQPYLAL